MLRYTNAYPAEIYQNIVDLLQSDGWRFCGKVDYYDGKLADMIIRDNEYIAVWEETAKSLTELVPKK